MQHENVQIDICVATFMRPTLLGQLLESLMQLRLVDNLSVRIVVIDNDAAGSARSIVSGFSGRQLPVVYDIEPIHNIALARNRSVANSTADFIAFIDDDELAEKDWLKTLLGALNKYAADAIFGPVIPTFPDNLPSWIRRGGFYDRPRFASGTRLEVGRTGNALVKGSWLRKCERPFDKEYGLSGGEDSDFFRRVRQDGGILIWCDNAIVYEKVPVDRLSVKYLAARAFSGGQIYAFSVLPKYGFAGMLKWFLLRVGLLIAALLLMLLAWPLVRRLRHCRKCAVT